MKGAFLKRSKGRRDGWRGRRPDRPAGREGQAGRPEEGRAPGKGAHGLARWISKFGLMSRTEAERSVLAGRVLVNGRPELNPDRPCNPDRDDIAVDGRPLRRFHRIYLAMNKPAGTITTAKDPQGRPTVYDLLPPSAGGVQAVGRLDADTSGLLLFTNDTAFAARITEAGDVEKVYRARLRGALKAEDGERFERGVEIEGRKTLSAKCRVIEYGGESTLVEVALVEGRNRQVRRMWDVLGRPVLEMERIRIGPIELGSLAPGRARPVTEYERVLVEKGERLDERHG